MITGSILVPYIFPLMLGRTIDLNTMRVGVDIFPKELIDKRLVYNFPSFKSYYGIIDSEYRRDDLLNIPNPFSTYIKTGILNAGVSGVYLSDIINYIRTVDMTSRVQSFSSIEYLPDYPKYPEPIPNWKDYGKALGTHYVHQVYYGGEMTTSMRFETNTKEDKKSIEPAISHSVFELGSHVQDEYLKNISKLIQSTEIKMFSSIPLSNVSNDMDSLKKQLEGGFGLDYKRFNTGRGLPLLVSLRPLYELDSSRNASVDERIFSYYLDAKKLDDCIDDLRETKALISHWMNNIVKPLTDEQEKKVSDLYNSIENMLKIFYGVLDTLGTPEGPEQLKKAMDAYEKSGPLTRSTFRHNYYRLRVEFDKDYIVGNGVQCSKQ